jgi:UDP-glucose 4-epimerase
MTLTHAPHRPGASLANRKVLITGGLGFIGSNLAHRCLELGADVAIYDNLDPHSGGTLYNVEDIRDSLEIHFHDILNFDALVERICERDIVFNCAASTSHPFSMREPWLDLDVNSRGVVNVLEALRRFNKRARLVHIGTSTQLGPLQYEPADENHPEFPTDIYSANKSASEKYVLVYARAYGLPATVIRLANVFGPRATIRSADFTFNNYFIGLALQDKDITVYGQGEQLRNVLYVDDAVDALIAAALSDKSHGQTFFAVGDHHYSVAQIAHMTVKCMGSGRVQHVPWPQDRQAVEIGKAVLSNAKIRDVLGWRPVHDFEDGLRRTFDYFKGCLGEYL